MQKKILMVCMGNICRSPTAEGVMRTALSRHGLDGLLAVDSAGTHAYHIGEAPDPRTVQAASRRGYDLSAQRARQVQAADFDVYNYMLVADRANLAALRRISQKGVTPQLLLSILGTEAEVPDPYYGGADGFECVLDLVEQACDAWCRHWRQQAGLD